MKKLLACLLALAMALSLAACGGTKADETEGIPAAEETAAESDVILPEEEEDGIALEYAEEEPEAEAETPYHPEDEAVLNAEGTVYEPVSGTIGVDAWEDGKGVFDVSFVGAEFYRSAADATCVRIWYDVTNTAPRLMEAMDVSILAAQDGDYLWSVDSDDSDTPQVHVRYVDIRPGVTVRCAAEYECAWDGGPIYVEGYYYMTLGDHLLNSLVYDGAESMETGLFGDSLIAVFDPAALPARPAVDDTTVPIAEPSWMDGVPDEGEVGYGDAYAAVKGSEVFTDGDDEILRVYVTFTNRSTSLVTASYFDILPDCRAMQDGIRLVDYAGAETVPEDGNRMAQIDYDESIDVALEFVLRSDSPVAFEFYDWGTNKPLVGAVLPGGPGNES